MSADVVTFGCRLNIYESEVIRREAESAGLGDELGDAVIFNTCAVTAEAVRQARQTIRRTRRERPSARIIVTGCAAQTDPQSFAGMPEVDRVIGNDEKFDGRHLTGGPRVAVGDIMASATIARPMIGRLKGHTRAFVQIQNGCDHRCTFCVIPFGRGNSRSLAPDIVIGQVRQVVDSGHCEVVLTGVDITSYGADLSGAPKLGVLVKRILREFPELVRLRLSSIDSVEADRELIDAFANEPRLMPHLHLSLQSGDDMILKRMKRRHTRGDAIAFCDELRALRPDVAFGADIIAGFPTETAEMFARSLDLVDECGLAQLHVFPFSPRPGTPAARMPAVARDIVKDRARHLREAGEAALRRHFDREVGARRAVLVELGNAGYTEQYMPVRFVAAQPPGNILNATITGHDGRQLLVA